MRVPWRVCRTGGPPLHFGGAATPVMRAGDTGVMRFDASGFASLSPYGTQPAGFSAATVKTGHVYTPAVCPGVRVRVCARVRVSETQKRWV